MAMMIIIAKKTCLLAAMSFAVGSAYYNAGRETGCLLVSP